MVLIGLDSIQMMIKTRQILQKSAKLRRNQAQIVQLSLKMQLGPVEGRQVRPNVTGGAALRGGLHFHFGRMVTVAVRRRVLFRRERIVAG